MLDRATPLAPALHLRGATLPDGLERDVFVANGRLTFNQPRDATTLLTGVYLIPGLVDAHAHLELASPAPADAPPVERARASARAHLDAGVLAIREPGGPTHSSVGLGPHDGLPRVITGGRFLAPPGGYFPGLAREVADEHLADAAEEEARASGAWVKVIGDFVGPDGRMRLNYRPATMAAAARRAHAAGARIAIHATTPDAIAAAIEAGFDSIEHGVGLRDEHLPRMAANGVALVPTMTILPDLPAALDAWELTPSWRATMLHAVAQHAKMVGRAAAAGVAIYAGTDAGMVAHGLIRQEIRNLTTAGLSPGAALAAGSWAARRFLGLPGLEEGAPADISAYRADPRDDPAALDHPCLRILDGRIVR